MAAAPGAARAAPDDALGTPGVVAVVHAGRGDEPTLRYLLGERPSPAPVPSSSVTAGPSLSRRPPTAPTSGSRGSTPRSGAPRHPPHDVAPRVTRGGATEDGDDGDDERTVALADTLLVTGDGAERLTDAPPRLAP